MKAIIPVAGFGTRLFPETKAIKKSFLPVLDKDGLLKPALLILLEQLNEADIKDICLVIGEDEKNIYDEFFKPLPKEHYDKLPEDKKKIEDEIINIGKNITYVIQSERKGFGHAVYLCKDFINNEPFLLLLGDTLYTSNTNDNCMVQMINAYNTYKQPIIAMHKIDLDNVIYYGMLHGIWQDTNESVLKLDLIIEKPTIEYAQDNLSIKNKDSNNNYYAVFGQYILTYEIFDILAKDINDNQSNNKEIELTSALEKLRLNVGTIGYVIQGKSYDTGIPEAYYNTMVNYSK